MQRLLETRSLTTDHRARAKDPDRKKMRQFWGILQLQRELTHRQPLPRYIAEVLNCLGDSWFEGCQAPTPLIATVTTYPRETITELSGSALISYRQRHVF
jgi:hypothetical protein